MKLLMWYYVYRITCHHPEALEKYYYGVRRSMKPPEEDTRYWSSSRYVKQALKTFGSTWFTKKIVSCYVTRDAAYAKEIRLHAFFDVKTHPLFFNRSNQTTAKFSREGVRCSPETVEKIRRIVRGRVLSPEALAKRVLRRGEIRSPEARQKMSKAQQGIRPSTETRAKMSASHRGKKHTPETRAKMSQARRLNILRQKRDLELDMLRIEKDNANE